MAPIPPPACPCLPFPSCLPVAGGGRAALKPQQTASSERRASRPQALGRLIVSDLCRRRGRCRTSRSTAKPLRLSVAAALFLLKESRSIDFWPNRRIQI